MTTKSDPMPTHTDHPIQHWDRTCPACNLVPDPTRASLVEQLRAAALHSSWQNPAIAKLTLNSIAADRIEELERQLAHALERSAMWAQSADAARAAAAAERERTLELQKALQAFQRFYPNAAQLMDGFLNSDPAAWSDWDRSVRTELIEVGRLVDAAMKEKV